MRSLRGKATLMAGGVAADAVGTALAPGGGTSTEAFSDASSEAYTS
jgi:hypothetical protein